MDVLFLGPPWPSCTMSPGRSYRREGCQALPSDPEGFRHSSPEAWLSPGPRPSPAHTWAESTCPSAAVTAAPALSGQDGPGFLQGPQKAASFGDKEPRPQRRLTVEPSLPAPFPRGRMNLGTCELRANPLLSGGPLARERFPRPSAARSRGRAGRPRAGAPVARPSGAEAEGLRNEDNMRPHARRARRERRGALARPRGPELICSPAATARPAPGLGVAGVAGGRPGLPRAR